MVYLSAGIGRMGQDDRYQQPLLRFEPNHLCESFCRLPPMGPLLVNLAQENPPRCRIDDSPFHIHCSDTLCPLGDLLSKTFRMALPDGILDSIFAPAVAPGGDQSKERGNLLVGLPGICSHLSVDANHRIRPGTLGCVEVLRIVEDDSRIVGMRLRIAPSVFLESILVSQGRFGPFEDTVVGVVKTKEAVEDNGDHQSQAKR